MNRKRLAPAAALAFWTGLLGPFIGNFAPEPWWWLGFVVAPLLVLAYCCPGRVLLALLLMAGD